MLIADRCYGNVQKKPTSSPHIPRPPPPPPPPKRESSGEYTRESHLARGNTRETPTAGDIRAHSEERLLV